MSEKYKCIICSHYLEGTEEHIIPKSLGNQSLKIWNVCKGCNSGLGTNVDSYLVNHQFIQTRRMILGLKGQSGQIPNPFKRGMDKNSEMVHVNEKFEVTYLPKVEETAGRVKIIASSKEEALNIAIKKLKRSGFSEAQIQEVRDKKLLEQNFCQEVKLLNSDINFEVFFDINLFCLAALKIAYEYACLKLGAKYCWEDCKAAKIRGMLYQASRGNKKVKYDDVWMMNPDLSNNVVHAMRFLTDYEFHLLLLHPDLENRLIVEIILFGCSSFSYTAIISENADIYNAELKLNGIEIIEVHN